MSDLIKNGIYVGHLNYTEYIVLISKYNKVRDMNLMITKL